MKLSYCYVVLFSLITMVFAGCGGSGGGAGGGQGLNGSITVIATPTGSVVNATATYSNPTATNLIGVPITFSAHIGSQTFPLGTFNTNNSGAVNVSFSPAAFNGTQTITIVASTGNLSNFASIVMSGRTLTVTPPANLTLTTTQAVGTAIPFTIPPAQGFVTITDPFTNVLDSHSITIAGLPVSSNPSDTLTLVSSTTTTNSGGTAVFPGANGTLIVPAIGAVETMTITWTVTDTVTGLIGTGVTTVTLTKTS